MKRGLLILSLLLIAFSFYGSERLQEPGGKGFSYRTVRMSITGPGSMDSTSVKSEKATLIVGLVGAGIFGTSALLIIPFALLYVNLVIDLTALIVSVVLCSTLATAGIVMMAVGFYLFYKRLAAQGRFSLTSFAAQKEQRVVTGMAFRFRL